MFMFFLFPFGAALAFLLFPVLGQLHSMVEQPTLTAAFHDSVARSQLSELGISKVHLYCSWPGKTLGARFEFSDLDGRATVEVAGTTHCTDSGQLVSIEYGFVRLARENYAISMVNSELLSLLAKAKIKTAVHDTNNTAAGNLLGAKFAKELANKNFGQVTFTCENAGEAYQYYEDRPYSAYRQKGTLQLNTKCVKAHQNFIVLRSPAADGLSFKPGEPLVYVHDFNSPPVSSVEAVFAEYIQEKPLTTTF